MFLEGFLLAQKRQKCQKVKFFFLGSGQELGLGTLSQVDEMYKMYIFWFQWVIETKSEVMSYYMNCLLHFIEFFNPTLTNLTSQIFDLENLGIFVVVAVGCFTWAAAEDLANFASYFQLPGASTSTASKPPQVTVTTSPSTAGKVGNLVLLAGEKCSPCFLLLQW